MIHGPAMAILEDVGVPVLKRAVVGDHLAMDRRVIQTPLNLYFISAYPYKIYSAASE
jgi:hypothetical protein